MKPGTSAKAKTDNKRPAILERRRDVTRRISETTRLIGFGLLATSYAIISDSGDFFVEMRANSPSLVRLMALAGVLAVFFDYLHYVLGYFTTERALDRTDVPNVYNVEWSTYRLEHFCFWAKQLAALVGCGLLIFLVAQSFG